MPKAKTNSNIADGVNEVEARRAAKETGEAAERDELARRGIVDEPVIDEPKRTARKTTTREQGKKR